MTLRRHIPLLLPMLAVGVTLSCVLVGFEPIGDDPDIMYRPLKAELARALARGTLPFWSDHLGLGVPLVAESHVAAFYPLNWLLYRVLDLAFAFRLSMWMHYVATAAGLYAYARCLGLEPWGSSLAAVSFSLCGFASVHSGHEPLYLVLPYLPLCLVAADRFAVSGRVAWLAALALSWGVQLTLGHFQIQMWTGGLAMLSGCWRIIADGAPPRRCALLVAALLAGAGIAAVQLATTWELTRISGFSRPYPQLASYRFPPSQWIQPFLPWMFASVNHEAYERYLATLATSPVESGFSIGTIPMIFAIIGLMDRRRPRRLAVWTLVVVASLALATMAQWSTTGYYIVTCVPGLGWFRCPGRYTLMASLGLSLLAGRGMDRTVSTRGFQVGIAVAVMLGIAAVAWVIHLMDQPGFLAIFEGSSLPWRSGIAFGAWFAAIAMVVLWRRRWLSSGMVVAVAAIELGLLFHTGPVEWGWSVAFPGESPIAARLRQEDGVGLVAGPPQNLLARMNLACAFPYMGITPPPPNYLLEGAKNAESATSPGVSPLFVRYGVSHGIWRENDAIPRSDTVFVAEDRALDALLVPDRSLRTQRWKIVKYDDAWPAAWASRKAAVVSGWAELFPRLLSVKSRDEAVYDRGDEPPDPQSPWAKTARVRSWDGTTAIVDHDGACDLTIRRTFYPGWSSSINGGPPHHVFKGNGGLQTVRLDGEGPSRVTFAYRPTRLTAASRISLAAIAVVLITFLASRFQPRPSDIPS